MHKEVEEFFDKLKAKGFVPEEDIAWVGVPIEFLSELGELKICPIRNCFYIKIGGVEFRECERSNPLDLRLERWFAWNLTGRSRKLFKILESKNEQ